MRNDRSGVAGRVLQPQNVQYRYAYQMTGSYAAAEDIVQETFLTFWRLRSTFDCDRGTCRTYLFGMARNLILKQWRDSPEEVMAADQDSVCLPTDPTWNERVEARKFRVYRFSEKR